MILTLAGGVGAARFLDGLTRVVDPEQVHIIGNTGDDTEIYGLSISPDLDSILYTLAGVANPVQGWGIENDTFEALGALGRLGEETWFLLGDRDLATHIFRTARLRAGAKLDAVTEELARRLEVRSVLQPMSNSPVRTVLRTPDGELAFQTYFVKRRAQDKVLSVVFDGAERARPTPGLLRALRTASAIVFCPSNPMISIGPILAVRGIRDAIQRRRCPSIAISPIVGGRAVKGPAADMMASMGKEVSAFGVAEMYRDLVDLFVLDNIDAELAPRIHRLGMQAVVTNTFMTGMAEKTALAQTVMNAVSEFRRA